MSSTSATQIEQSVSAQQLTASDEQALYHLHQQYNEQHHEQLQLQDPSKANMYDTVVFEGDGKTLPYLKMEQTLWPR